MGRPKHKNAQSDAGLSAAEYAERICSGDRVVLGRAITLVESELRSDQDLANDLLQEILPNTGNSIRVGVTGVPGVGKSTFIEAFGTLLTSLNHRVAVLAIDPSSRSTKGSILGDKTRMEQLSRNTKAFVRPTSTGNQMGGVAKRTKEALLLCEAAGYDVVLIETVGVGQSEFAVREVVDFFLLLMLGGAGDELQGIKKGIIEMADGVAITKADGDNLKKALQAKTDYQQALHFLPKSDSGWTPKVLLTSASEKKGMKETWQMIEQYVERTRGTGYFARNRKHQDLSWLHTSLETKFHQELLRSEKAQSMIKEFEGKVLSKEISAGKAAQLIWEAFANTI